MPTLPPCPYCPEQDAWIGRATTAITTEGGDKVTVCRSCANDYHDYLREFDNPYATDGYDGPHYADTMSGGCTYLGG